MREVYLSDLTAAARALLAVPPHQRVHLCHDMLNEADWADKYAKRLRKPHQKWGNGTLMAAARGRHLAAERSFSDPEFASCFMIVLQQMAQYRATKTCKSGLHAHMRIKLHHGFAFG
ncbi:MAG: DUF7742 family protein [Sulfitobacter sp.]